MPSFLFKNKTSAGSYNSSRILVRSAKTDLVKKTIKKISVYPNIFGPHHDCGMCGGHGCSRCS